MSDFLAWMGVTSATMQEKVITGLFSFAGVLITGLIAIAIWFGNQVVTRQEARRARQEKTRDVQTALLAEVEAIYWQHASTERNVGGLDALSEMLRRRFADARVAGRAYTPYVTAESGAVVFEALKGDISVLEHEEIRPVVQFYRQVALIEKFAEEMKTDRFYALDSERKEAMAIDYLRMVGTVVKLGDGARRALAASLGVETSDSPFAEVLNKEEPARNPPASPAAASQAEGPTEQPT